LTADEKLELQRKKERFEGLPEADQQRLRDLHEQLTGRADSEQLMLVLQRYAQWLTSLPSGQRAKLLDLPPRERIEQIREMKRRWEESLFGQLTASGLSPEDTRHVFDWLDELVVGKEDELRQQLNEEPRWLDRIRDGSRRRSALLGMLLRERGPEALPQPSAEQVDGLVQQLSDKAQERFRSQTDASQRQRLVQQWIQAALLSRWLPPPVSEKELQRFFVEDLTSQERASLEGLPRERLSHELRRRYHHYQLRRRMPGGDFDAGRPRGERPRRFGPPSFDRSPRDERRGGSDRRDGSRPPGPPQDDEEANRRERGEQSRRGGERRQ
jgi:hypothetical protein